MICGRFEKGYHNRKLLALVVMGAIGLTGFLFEDGSRNNGLIDRVRIEGHVVCAAYVIDPQSFVCLWQVVDTDVGGGARVQSAGWSVSQEASTEPLAVSLGHGHVTLRRVDDVSSAVGIAFWLTVSVVVPGRRRWIGVAWGPVRVSVWGVLLTALFVRCILRSEL